MERMNVHPAVQGSWDSIIHNLNNGRNGLLIFRDDKSQTFTKDKKYLLKEVEDKIKGAEQKKGQRAIGVVYNPEYERYGNYVPTVLHHTNRYDTFVYIDRSEAMHPLHMLSESGEIKEDLPETFPTGL